MKFRSFLYLLAAALWSLPAQAQISTGRNFVATTDVLMPGITTQAQVDTLTVGRRLRTVKYFDGLGRPIQTVSMQTSPAGKDVVSPEEYDGFGREVKKFLPYVDAGTTYGSLRTTAYADQSNFYSPSNLTAVNIARDAAPFSQAYQEYSPLNRLIDQGDPGAVWQPAGGHSKKMMWSSNILSDSVHRWTIAAAQGSLPVTNSIYAAGELTVLTTTDDVGHQTLEYRDKENKPILRKVQLLNTGMLAHYGWLCTYYVYDDFNMLRCMLQPRAVELVNNGTNTWTVTQAIADELAFRYEFDQRHRMIIKKAPGVAETWMVYDARDRLVMTQDGALRTLHKWHVTRYDALNRPDTTGLILDPTNYGNLAYHLSQAASSTSYPILANYTNELQTATFYDDYAWAVTFNPGVALGSTWYSQLSPANNTPPYAVTPAFYSSTRGQTTGTMTNVLGTSTFLYSLQFFDDHSRVIQMQSINSTGAIDTTTTQYTFSGQPITVIINHQKALNTPQHHDMLTRMSYDAAQRLKTVRKNIDNVTGEQLIDSLQYNELGQLRGKYLGGAIDSLLYEYNIRGWMTGINRKYVGGGTTNYFGEELAYDNATSVVAGSTYTSQYGGNIGGLTWKTAGDSTKRKYDFSYDNINRLTVANFQQNMGSGWSNGLVDYTVNNLTYDANGNILSMNQKGFKWNGSDFIDRLTYTYQNSNKLKQVADLSNDSLSQLGDFHFRGTKQSSDYNYDANGNVILDNNKAIDSILYNYLNLPQKIHIKGKGNILYTYDAAGNKLKKVTMDSLSRRAITTLYIGGFVYQHNDTITNPAIVIDTLQFVTHEEGRVRWALHYYQNGSKGYGWESDFYEKDHLGNVRMVLTTQRDTTAYLASMEAAYRSKENALFYNIPQTAYSRVLAGYPVDLSTTNPNDSVIALNGTAGKTQGPAIILKVMAGDIVSVGAKCFYNSQTGTIPRNTAVSDLVASLASGLVGLTGGGKGSLGDLTTGSSPLYGALNSFVTNKEDTTLSSKPRAYLNYMFLDNQYQYDVARSGAMAVGNYTAGTLGPMAQSNIVAGKNGYLYVWVSNESQGWPVFFDNLSVQVRSGPILEETHYYPYGLTMAAISDKALKGGYVENKYRYNGKELQSREFSDGTGLDEYDYGARFYDHQIGRFHSIDPHLDKYPVISPYSYVQNNPILGTDPTGMDTYLSGAAAVEFAKTIQSMMRHSIDVYDRIAQLKKNEHGGESKENFTINIKAILPVWESIMPETYAHIRDAIAAGKPAVLTRTTPFLGDLNRRVALAGHKNLHPDINWMDEYPFASTEEGGFGASVREVVIWEQGLQAGQISALYTYVNVGQKFLVWPVSKETYKYYTAPRYYKKHHLEPSKRWMERPKMDTQEDNGPGILDLAPVAQKLIERIVRLPIFVPPSMMPQPGPVIIP